MHTLVENELQRLRSEIGLAERPDAVDVAVIEMLASSHVQQLLGEVLDDGAILGGIRLQDMVGPVGVACFIVDTQWPQASLRTSPPLAVAVLVELSPPRVLKAAKVEIYSGLVTEALIAPKGPTPIVLNDLGAPLQDEVSKSRSAIRNLLEEWRSRCGLLGGDRLVAPPAVVTLEKAEFRSNVSSYPTQYGTDCSSAMCFEKYQDHTKVDP